MIGRNLMRRIEALETRIAPATEPLIVQIMYVTPDGSEEDADRFELPMPLAYGNLRGRGSIKKAGFGRFTVVTDLRAFRHP
jgi:hypothetical protein